MNIDVLLLLFQAFNLFVLTLTFVAVVIYVWKTWEMASATRDAAEATKSTVDEMRAARKQESAPHIIAYFDVPYGSQLIYLVVKNIGKGTATDVGLEFDPPLQASSQDLVDGLEFLRTGFASMPPDYEYRTFIDTTIQYLGAEDLPLTYHVSIDYSGGLIEGLEQRIVTIDLGHLMGRMFTTQKGIEDLAKSVDKLQNNHANVARTLDHIKSSLRKGLFIRNANITVVDGLPDSIEQWHARLLAKLNEFVALWNKAADAELSTGVGFYDLQSRIRILSDEVDFILAAHPVSVAQTLVDEVTDISLTLARISGQRLHIGGESLEEINKSGDGLVTRIVGLEKSIAELDPSREPGN